MFERFSRTAKVAVVLAQEEARELRATHIDVEHVLLGIVAAADGPLRTLLDDVGLTPAAVRGALMQRRTQPLGAEDAAALKSIGIDLDEVLQALAANFGADALQEPLVQPRKRWFGGHLPFTAGAKQVLVRSLREAVAHKDSRILGEHLLLGVVGAPNTVTRALIDAHLALPELRARLLELLDRAA